MGILADKWGYKKIILAGLAMFAAVYGGFAFRPSIGVIFILFSVYGLYAAATEGVIKAWVANLAHKENTATAIGFYTSCESICTLLASIIAGVIWTSFGSSATFLTTAIIAAVVFIYFQLKIKTSQF
jgi:MFS family permease